MGVNRISTNQGFSDYKCPECGKFTYAGDRVRHEKGCSIGAARAAERAKFRKPARVIDPFANQPGGAGEVSESTRVALQHDFETHDDDGRRTPAQLDREIAAALADKKKGR
jgi:hypothetical protein